MDGGPAGETTPATYPLAQTPTRLVIRRFGMNARERAAVALLAAEREYRAAQTTHDGSDAARARYAAAAWRLAVAEAMALAARRQPWFVAL